MPDLFEQLADAEVPPPPKSLRRGVHRRLNRWLIALHVVEFVLQVIPYAAGLFVRAVGGWSVLTFTGRHAIERTPRSPLDDRLS